ncbi:MAG: hypothetical protein CMM31_10625 [Rhodospirillaceae bacterium]|nr:hypothetical protein [Rhodospirillaceae bacterium]
MIFESGQGSTITDVDGNDYLDFTSGMMCLPLGHAHAELTETLREQAGRFVHENSWFSNPQLVAFAEALIATLPPELDVVNFTVTGSEANVEIGCHDADTVIERRARGLGRNAGAAGKLEHVPVHRRFQARRQVRRIILEQKRPEGAVIGFRDIADKANIGIANFVP